VISRSQSSRRISPSVASARDERALGQGSPEVPRLRVRQDLARVALRAKYSPDKRVEAELLRAADLDDLVRWGPGGSASDRRGNVLGRHRLDQCLRQVDRVAMRRVIGDLVDELEELGGVDDGVGDRRSLDQGLLRELRPEVRADRGERCPRSRARSRWSPSQRVTFPNAFPDCDLIAGAQGFDTRQAHIDSFLQRLQCSVP
jgi:hypothetical protein